MIPPLEYHSASAPCRDDSGRAEACKSTPQHSTLSAAPEQNPNSLHVRAPQQSQSDMQVEAAAVLRAGEEKGGGSDEFGLAEGNGNGQNTNKRAMCQGLGWFGREGWVGSVRVALVDDKRTAGAAARQALRARCADESRTSGCSSLGVGVNLGAGWRR
jgi:hypothetical protein